MKAVLDGDQSLTMSTCGMNRTGYEILSDTSLYLAKKSMRVRGSGNSLEQGLGVYIKMLYDDSNTMKLAKVNMLSGILTS